VHTVAADIKQAKKKSRGVSVM